MHMPTLHGTFDQQDFFIYAACDQAYFEEFGPAFIGSIRTNTTHNIHLHLFNPTAEQIAFCQRRGVGVTWEHALRPLFIKSAERWQTTPTTEPALTQYTRTQNAMIKGKDSNLLERMQKTYYACARFVRLAQLDCKHTVLAIDIDAVVRGPVPMLGLDKDFFIHYISGRRARYLAGGIWLNNNAQCQTFLTQYADQLRSYIDQDYLYWSLDQDLLDAVVPKFQHGQLPTEYIDWNMNSNSYIWTAKGTRKELAAFVSEQQKYVV
jgi:hypothetical protein